MKRTLLHADDVGLNHEVNQTSWLLYKEGRLAGFSLLPNSQATTEAVKLFRGVRIPIFLHFNLIEGHPVAKPESISSLVDSSGHFFPTHELIRRIIFRRIHTSHIEIELDAQINKIRTLGIRVYGIDSHQHLHAFSPVAEVVYRTAQENGLHLRSYSQMKVISARGYVKINLLRTASYITHSVYFSETKLPVTWKVKLWKSFFIGSWESVEVSKVSSSAVLVCHPGLNYDRIPIV